MLRLYVSNHSYPELREIESRWERHVAWWRALGSAARDPRLWGFFALELILVAGWIAIDGLLVRMLELPEFQRYAVHVPIALAAGAGWSVLMLSWGGDLVRPHLRRVSLIARHACPSCGHQLTSQLVAGDSEIRCPECGTDSPATVFQPPYRIPREHHAFRVW